MTKISKHTSSSLSISCVLYDTPQHIVNNTLSSLALALNYAKEKLILSSSELYLINNNPNFDSTFLKTINENSTKFEKIIISNGHGNIGYGAGNNLAIHATNCQIHLILNPDVELAIDSLYEGILYLLTHAEVGVVAPSVTNQMGEIEYLAKRKPSPFVILLRGLGIGVLDKKFKKMLDKYAYKDKIPRNDPLEIELASGCFMLCKTSILHSINGFSEEFFLYFEDFDLSERIRKNFKIFYLPKVKIKHLGGKAASKNIKHKYLFIKSAIVYFLKH